jgi:hypothetical protein
MMAFFSIVLASFVGSFCGAYIALWQERQRAARATMQTRPEFTP